MRMVTIRNALQCESHCGILIGNGWKDPGAFKVRELSLWVTD